MAILTAQDFSDQMVAQLRVLDPSISAEIGTPERKIIDTVAQALSENQVDLTGLSAALDIDSKYGTNLDQFTALFGFGRQTALPASGYVIFSRTTPAPATIVIPTGVVVRSNTPNADGQYYQYVTTAGATITAGQTTSGSVPISCAVAGVAGNAAANTLTVLVGALVGGVTAVTNAAPLSGGSDVETDPSYKTRFKNTVFRNMAGTLDQYLATAVSTSFTSKANVVGPVSTYQEYVQVPAYDDAGFLNGVRTTTAIAGGASSTPSPSVGGTYTVNVLSTAGAPSVGQILITGAPNAISYGGITGTSFTNCTGGYGQSYLNNAAVVVQGSFNGIQGQWTTALSSIPYAQDIYTNPTAFVSNGQTQTALNYFFRPGTDFNFNYPPTIFGDAWRETQSALTIAPNFTFLNVYNPSAGTVAAGTQSITPKGVLLTEFRYLSSASRNSISHNVQNCVDVFVDGSNPTQASATFQPGQLAFTTAANVALSIENFRRDGLPQTRPHPGNYFTPLFNTPLTSIPTTITIGTTVYYMGFHYWLVHDISGLGGSTRSRDGIEWSNMIGGDAGSQTPPGWPTPTATNYQQPYNTTTGPLFNAQPAGTQVTVSNYLYDANIPVLQGAMETVRQITTDVLVHGARTRYFKVDVTVMYSANFSPTVTNSAVGSALTAYFNNQFFGTVIQLSDVLEVIHQVPGIDNVRWSNDLPQVPNLIRVIETDVNGNPLHVPTIDRIVLGTASVNETQRLYIPGNTAQGVNNFGATDNFTVTWADPAVNSGVPFSSAAISFASATTQSAAANAAYVQAQLRNNGGLAPSNSLTTSYNTLTVTQDTWQVNSNYPMTSFLITYPLISIAPNAPYVPYVSTSSISASPFDFDSDFFLRDNELPLLPANALATDTIPGAIIRPRAQNVWVRPGIN